MPYQVLALKWRPQVFEDVIGQEPVTLTLRNAIQQGRIAHAFLFSGVRGVGKTTTARILAKALNCESGPTVRPCGGCAACREIATSSSLDVLEIDGASNNGVEQVREIVEASRYAPSRDRFKIYIIDEVHMLTTAAFNALLKTLEEPPPRVKFIFATTEYHKIPETILSRCQQFEFRTVAGTRIAEQLRRIAEKESIDIPDEALIQVARAAEGSIRDALSALDQVLSAVGNEVTERDVTELLGLIDRDVLRDTAQAILDRDTASILRIVDELVLNGRDLRSFARGLMQYFRDVLVVRVAPGETDLVELVGERDELAGLAARVSEEDLIRTLDVLTQVESSLRWSPEPRYHLEIALLKLSQLGRLASFEDLLARFEALSGESMGKRNVPSGSGGEGEVARRLPVSRKVDRVPKTRTVGAQGLESNREEESTEDRIASPGSTPSEAEAVPSRAREILEGVLERIRNDKPMLHAVLARHHRVSLEENALKVWFIEDHKLLHERLEQKESQQLLDRCASEVAGSRLQLVIGVEEPDAPPSVAQKREDTGRTALRERALEDPLVRRFVETFQGEVDEVRDLDRADIDER